MRELVLHTHCDEHFDTEETKVEDPDGTSPKIDVPFRGMLRIDLCSQCDKALVQPLREVLAGLPTVAVETQPPPRAVARPAASATPVEQGEPHDCVYCLFTSPKRADLINHYWGVHTKSGRTGKFAVPEKCPTCKAGPFGGNQGMSAHRSSIHGYDAMAEALKGTKAKGNFKWSRGYAERPGAATHG